MENYYFPLFLVVVGALVFWIFRRAGSRSRRSVRRRSAKTPAGRTAGVNRLHRNTDRLGPAARSRHFKPNDVWQTKRHHADKESFVDTAARPAVFHAGNFNAFDESERKAYARHELKDQNITESEHLGIDEYLTKREAERAAAEAEKAGGLSMTAMKYEPTDASAEEKERKKQASFKP